MEDTTAPLLAKAGTRTARLCLKSATTVPSPAERRRPRFQVSRDREMAHPDRHLAGWQGILQVPSHGLRANHCRAMGAYGGYNDLYRGDHDPGPVISALCWSHARRKPFERAELKGNVRKGKPAHDISPVALEAVNRIDAIFDVGRSLNGLSAAAQLEARQRLVRRLVDDLHVWMCAERDTMSRHNPVAKAIAYMFRTGRWEAFTRSGSLRGPAGAPAHLHLHDGRIGLTNDAAERTLRGVAPGRKSWFFAGSERGGDRAAFMYTLIITAKMNDIDAQAW